MFNYDNSIKFISIFLMSLLFTLQLQYYGGHSGYASSNPTPTSTLPTLSPFISNVPAEPILSSNSNQGCATEEEVNCNMPVTFTSNADDPLLLCENSTSDHDVDIKTKTKSKTNDDTNSNIKNLTKGSTKFVFINSYWTDNTILGGVAAGSASGQTSAQSLAPVIRAEVGPGEGDSVLAITLVNRGFVSLTSITGELKLPPGFQSIVSLKNRDPSVAISSFPTTQDDQVDPGQTFILYFPVNILDNAKVGKTYNSDLKIKYLKVTDESKTNLQIEKSTKSKSRLEIPDPCFDDDDNTNRTRTNTDRDINAKTVHTPFNSKSQTLQVSFKLSGKVILDVIGVSKSTPVGSNLTSLSSGNFNLISAVPGESNGIKLVIDNIGSASATGVIATISGRTESTSSSNIITPTLAGNISRNVVQQSSIIPLIVLGGTVFNLGTVTPSQEKEVSTIIFPNNLAAGTLETLNIQLQFNDSYGNKKVINDIVGIQILPVSPQNELTVTPVPSS
jgi:hypothetical protein